MTEPAVPRASTMRIALPDGLPNGGVPLPALVTSGQPTAEQLAQLAAAGVSVVIDLRAKAEPRGFDEPATAARLGLEYHNVPVDGASVGAPEFDAVRALLAASSTRPTLLHCKSANRVGAVLVPWLVLDERRSREEAVEIARQVGLRSDEMTRAALDYVDAEQHRG